MKRKWTGLFLSALLLGVSLRVSAECDCLPRSSVRQFSLKQAEEALLVNPVLKGDFRSADTLLGRACDPNSPFVMQLRTVLDEYRLAREGWEEKSRQRLEELQDKIRTQRAAAEEAPPDRPDEIMALIVQARQLAGPNEQIIAETDPFMVSLTDQIHQKIRDWESRGEDAKAWRYGLRILLISDPNSVPLRERRDDLLEKISIERALTPAICPGQPDPYTNVKAEVLLGVLMFLERNYATPVNFSSLSRKAIDYCQRLGQVLTCGRKDFLYTADPNGLGPWNDRIRQMAQEPAAPEGAEFTSALCIQRLGRILDLNRRTLRLPEGFLVYGLSEAMLGELDPYTEIVWPSRSEEFDKQMTGEFAGVGVRIMLEEKKLKILEVVAGSPAQESGRLKADDWITAIDGRSTQSLSLDCAVRQISGPEGTPVALTIGRDGQEETVSIVRRKIVLPSLHGTTPKLSEPKGSSSDLSAYRIDRDERIGYVWISSFRQDTPQTLREVLGRLEARGLSGLLLDLRSNSGGILESAAGAANLFLTEGVIVKSQTRQGQRLEFSAQPDEVLKDIPIVVLIDESTASGAEILAGALSEPGRPRATLVGTRTYGKGSVQEVEPLAPDGSRIKYTRGFYTLSGDRQVPNRYQLDRQGRRDWGLAPDVEVPLKDHQVSELARVQRQLQQLSGEAAQSGEEKLSEEKMALLESLVRSDPQMATGLTILKAKILAGTIKPQTLPDPNEPAAP
jgi:carboxyl-terminal processing protease